MKKLKLAICWFHKLTYLLQISFIIPFIHLFVNNLIMVVFQTKIHLLFSVECWRLPQFCCLFKGKSKL